MVADARDATRAAVLVPLYNTHTASYLLLTKRTETVEHHKGQISLPGGVVDKSDKDFLGTALRETYEEVGIREQDIEVLGALDDTFTVTGFLITPFVGFIPHPYDIKPNKDEVDEVLHVPVGFFMDPKNSKEEPFVRNGSTYIICSYSYKDIWIWGATARIIKHFVELLAESPEPG